MMNKSRLARAALTIAQQLGRREEWADPETLLEGIAAELTAAGLPAVGDDDTRAYWQHMSVDDALGRALVNDIEDDDRPHTFSVHIDASTATPEAIAAIFEGMHRMIHPDPPIIATFPTKPHLFDDVDPGPGNRNVGGGYFARSSDL